MKTLLVTGSDGFIGKNLCAALRLRDDVELITYDIGNEEGVLKKSLLLADTIYHLAGVNRPQDPSEFGKVNFGLTGHICSFVESAGKKPKIVFASSIQAGMNNPYGISKKKAEDRLRDLSEKTGATCIVHRLKNLFGKWCRPNYNSVTATFCHNIANDMPIEIFDRDKEIELTYIDDVIDAFVNELSIPDSYSFSIAPSLKSYETTLGNLADSIINFHQIRTSLVLPDLSSPFIKALYATYLSYSRGDKCLYTLEVKADIRGTLAEFIKSNYFGQIFISRTKPGVTRGNHYHHTKIEKFMVVQGKAVIRLRSILGKDIFEHFVDGQDYQVVDIPPGFTHSITNIGNDDLVTIFWADEIFNHEKTDTFFEEL